MPVFCGSCGSPLGGQAGFCGSCGARAGGAPAGPPAAVAPPAAAQSAATGGSALKIVLIVVGVMFVLGALSLGGMYYAAHRYIKMAEDVTGVNAGDALHSIREAAARNAHGGQETKRDGCLLLSQQEASAILEIEVIRVDGKPNDHESGEHCDFFVKPESVEQNLEKLRKAADAIKSDPNVPAQADKLPPGAADMLKTFRAAWRKAPQMARRRILVSPSTAKTAGSPSLPFRWHRA